jgi:replicative DNA helicase
MSAPILPFSETIERDTVGILMMQGAEHIERASEFLSDAHFHHVGYRAIWKHVHSLWTAGKPINDVHVIEAMRSNGTLDSNGGASLVFDVSTNGERYYAEAAKHSLTEFLPKLEAYRQARVGVDASLRLQQAAQACDIAAMQSSAEDVLRCTTTSERKRKGKTWHDIGKEWLNRDITKLKGVTTGFRWLDENLGGLRRQNLLVIAGGASDGKTSLALNIMLNAANEGHHVALFSQEMGLEENWERGLAYEKSVRSSAIMNGILNPREYQGLEEYCKEHKPVYAYDDCATIDEIEAEVRLCVARHNTRIAVVDYLQIVDGDKKLNREQEVSEVGKRLKQLAKRFQITVIAMSQLNDDGKARESRAIKMHCDQMLTIMVKEDDDTARCIKIDKNRGGKRYVKCAYKFEGQHFTFHEIGQITDKEKDEFSEKTKHPQRKGQRS